MRRRFSVPLLLLLLSLVVPLRAAEPAAEEPAADEHVVVTSTRLDDQPAPKAEIPASITVIDREAIARSGARTVQDLLVEEAGVIVYDQVGNDVQKTLDLRGFSGGRGIAVFVDGARVNDTRNNTVALEDIPLAAVERIEITRGPASALAGGGSQAGVIRIVTRRGAKPEASVSVAGGTWNTLRVDGSYGQDFGLVDLFASASHDTTDGFRANAGGDSTRADATLGFDLGGDRRLALSLLGSGLDYGNPGALTLDEFDQDPTANVFNVLDFTDSKTYQAALNFQGPVGGGFTLAANASYRDASVQALTTGRSASIFGGFFLDSDGGTWTGTVQATRGFKLSRGSNQISFGLEATDGDVTSLGYFTPPASPGTYDPSNPSSENTAEAVTSALFVQDAWSPSARWTLVAGARADRARVVYDETIPDPTYGDSKSFSEVSFRAGATFRPSEAVDVYASYGDAFLPPTAEQLFAFPLFGSNPDLVPQDARAYEAGVRARGAAGTLDAAVFWIDTRDEIVFDPTILPFGANVNAGSTRRAGVELALRGRLARRVTAFCNLTYTDAQFTNGPDDGNTIPLVPEFRAGAGIDAGLPAGFRLRLDGLYVGDQVLDNDTANAQAELDAYAIVNVRLAWERALSVTAGSRAGRIGFFAEADNALDEVYATRGIYAFNSFVTPAPGRRYLAGVTWRM